MSGSSGTSDSILYGPRFDVADFAGKTVVVTGGAHGIGEATASRFVDLGAEVWVWDTKVAGSNGVRAVRCDVGVPGDIEQAAAQVERVDVLVNNAGMGWPGGLFELTVEEWDRVLAVNLRSAWLTTKLLAPKMPPGSAIVNIASTRALMSEPGTEPYSASKGGLVALTHAMAATLSERRIRVNCVSPGWIDVAGEPLSEAAHGQHWTGRVGRPGDIAEAVVYLASPAAQFVTGANLVVDGGMTRKMIYEE